jgi:hypothetical protein
MTSFAGKPLFNWLLFESDSQDDGDAVAGDGGAIAATVPVIPTIKISSSKSSPRHVCHAESPPQDAIARQ